MIADRTDPILTMQKLINSPIVIAALVIFAAFILQSQTKSHLGAEIRGAYEELIAIAEDASSDTEKTKAIQSFAEQIATQIREGFSAGFSKPTKEDAEESDEARFLRVKRAVEVTGVKETPSPYEGRQSVLFTVSNKSEFAIRSIKVNLDYYRGGELIDTKNEWLSEVEVLDCQESINVKEDRSISSKLSAEEQAAQTFDQVTVSVTSFRIVEK